MGDGIAILFRRLGPYHWARLNAVAQRFPTLAIEFSASTKDYKWDPVAGQSDFVRVTVSPDREADNLPPAEYERRLCRMLDQQAPKVVVVPGWSDRGALLALRWAIRNRVPSIMMSDSQEHDDERRPWREIPKQRVVRLCDAALVAGERHRKYIASLGMRRGAIFTGYDVVDNEYFAKGARAAREAGGPLRQRLGLPERYFLASSRFIPKKNLALLMRAYAEYRRSVREPWGLVLLGDGPLGAELLTLRSSLGLTDSLVMPGFRQYSELPPYYGLASAFVHASTTEQWGLVVNEALASGLPAIVSRECGCVPELVHEGVNGFSFDPRSEAGLSSLLTRMSSNRVDLAGMSRASEAIVAKWSPTAFVQGLSQAIEVACGPNRERRSTLVDDVLLSLLARR